MRFNVSLQGVTQLPSLPLEYDEELDDVGSILHDLCAALEQTQSAVFSVSGFGQEEWPVDVGFDFCTFLEQLPKALACARAGEAFEIALYEQGMQRSIRFESTGSDYVARCTSATAWQPVPETERLNRFELVGMLSRAFSEVITFVSRIPSLAAHPWVREWEKEGRR